MRFFKNIIITYLYFYMFLTFSEASLNILSIDERWICNIKNSCEACLQLPQCSWCPEENVCFSETLPRNENYCVEKRIRFPSYEMSLEENAICACSAPEVQNSCPAGEPEPHCSGRGKCACGRCFCDANPDPLHPTKVIIGEHCEYDNFSCEGPKCNEGPYNILQENELGLYDEPVET